MLKAYFFLIHFLILFFSPRKKVQANPSRVPDPVALLVITKQPFPCTVKQSKSVDDTVEVQVITGARVDIQGKLYCCWVSFNCSNNLQLFRTQHSSGRVDKWGLQPYHEKEELRASNSKRRGTFGRKWRCMFSLLCSFFHSQFSFLRPPLEDLLSLMVPVLSPSICASVLM